MHVHLPLATGTPLEMSLGQGCFTRHQSQDFCPGEGKRILFLSQEDGGPEVLGMPLLLRLW